MERLKCDPEPLKLWLNPQSSGAHMVSGTLFLNAGTSPPGLLYPHLKPPLDVILLGKDVLLFRAISLQLRLNLESIKPVG